MLKVELHAHTADDPADWIPYEATTLVDRAAELGYGALAITLHDRQLDLAELEAYARERGVVLVPGVERTLFGKHVLLLNFPRAAEAVRDFDEIARLKARSNGLVIAPHPFFPYVNCLGSRLERHAGVFDAVELNAFHTRFVDFNRPAVRWAKAHGKPVVANADVHRLYQLGKTYTLVDAVPEADAICEAIRAGRVEIRTEPLTMMAAARHIASLTFAKRVRKSSVRSPDAVYWTAK
jgi:hypothetical protein